jgi:hypothetical protein
MNKLEPVSTRWRALSQARGRRLRSAPFSLWYIWGVEETPLEKATRHTMTGARIVARQELLMIRRAHGHDTGAAEALLDRFIATQHIFEDDMRAALKASGLDKRGSVAISPPAYEPRSAKMERFAQALSVGWMTRAAQA